MKFFFTSSLWLLLVLATPSALVVAKKDKKTKNTKIKNNLGPLRPLGGGGSSLNCDPMSPYDSIDQGCHDNDCVCQVWKDGCLACMCFNKGNTLWCDGTQSAYYDNYFEANGVNPFGDSNRSNRKCNTIFSPRYDRCLWDWECESGLYCENNYKLYICIS